MIPETYARDTRRTQICNGFQFHLVTRHVGLGLDCEAVRDSDVEFDAARGPHRRALVAFMP